MFNNKKYSFFCQGSECIASFWISIYHVISRANFRLVLKNVWRVKIISLLLIYEYSNLVKNMSTTYYLSLSSMLGRAGYWCGRNSECPQKTHCYKYATTIPFHIKLLSINITGIELWLQQWEVGALSIALLKHPRLFLFNIIYKSLV